jgi:Flp pilus assembly protein TadD
MRKGLLLVVMFIVLASCGGTSPKEAAAAACGHFRTAIDDIGAGRLTGKELKTRMERISTDADDASVEMKFAAQHLSDAAAKANLEGLSSAAEEMNSACEAAGEKTADLGGETSQTFSCTASSIASPGSTPDC